MDWVLLCLVFLYVLEFLFLIQGDVNNRNVGFIDILIFILNILYSVW